MVEMSVADLRVELIRSHVATHEVVNAPLENPKCVFILARGFVAGFELMETPSKSMDRHRSWKMELDKISSVIKSACKIDADIAAVCNCRVAAPRDSMPVRERTSHLRFVEENAFF